MRGSDSSSSLDSLIDRFQRLKATSPTLEQITANMNTQTYPTFQMCGKYDGSTPAMRWLHKLQLDFRPHYAKVEPETFFEAIEVLFVGKAESWLDSVPRFNRFTDQEEVPKDIDVEEFKQALMQQFPKKSMGDMRDGNVQEDIQNLKQGEEETLVAYHERVQDLLRRSNGRDDRNEISPELSGIERTMLSIIVRAFIRGMKDDNLRSTIMMKSAIFFGSLQGAFEKTRKAMANMIQREEIEKERLERMELDHFRNQYLQQWGRPLSVALAGMSLPQGHTNVIPSRMPYNHKEIWPTPAPGVEIQGATDLSRGINQGQPAAPQQAPITRPEQPPMGPKYQSNRYNQRSKPPKHLSRHPIVNGSRAYSKDAGVLCIRCGELGHKRPECTQKPLEWWEQTYLKDLVMPSIDANYAGYLDGGAGPRYRDIENSSWRGALRHHGADKVETRAVNESKSEAGQKYDDIPNYTYEQFTGTGFREMERQRADCMSVMLKFGEDEEVTRPWKVEKRHMQHLLDTRRVMESGATKFENLMPLVGDRPVLGEHLRAPRIRENRKPVYHKVRSNSMCLQAPGVVLETMEDSGRPGSSYDKNSRDSLMIDNDAGASYFMPGSRDDWRIEGMQAYESGKESVPKCPVERRPVPRTLSQAPQDEINDWFISTKATLGNLSEEKRDKVTRLLYTYRDLDSVELEELPPTDLYVHRVRLKEGTPPFNRPKQRRWPPGKEFWLRRIVNDGNKIPRHFHGDSLKPFRLREGYLVSSREERLPAFQNIRLGTAAFTLPKNQRTVPGVWILYSLVIRQSVSAPVEN